MATRAGAGAGGACASGSQSVSGGGHRRLRSFARSLSSSWEIRYTSTAQAWASCAMVTQRRKQVRVHAWRLPRQPVQVGSGVSRSCCRRTSVRRTTSRNEECLNGAALGGGGGTGPFCRRALHASLSLCLSAKVRLRRYVWPHLEHCHGIVPTGWMGGLRVCCAATMALSDRASATNDLRAGTSSREASRSRRYERNSSYLAARRVRPARE